jgi:hypothetical protein
MTELRTIPAQAGIADYRRSRVGGDVGGCQPRPWAGWRRRTLSGLLIAVLLGCLPLAAGCGSSRAGGGVSTTSTTTPAFPGGHD